MSYREKEKIRETLKDLPLNKRLFRINAGMGWTGSIIKQDQGKIVLKNPRAFHGAPSGWPDLAGWETITVSQEMVGKKIAVFVGEEVKVTGNLNKNQKRFRDILTKMGGLFRVLRVFCFC